MGSTAVLVPIEFKDCLTDSPEFRRKLQNHEKELDRTSQAIKGLTKEIKSLVHAAKLLSDAQKGLMERLRHFAKDPNKANLTEDELVISKSFNAFAQIIDIVEEERHRMLARAEEQIIGPLEAFRKDAIGGAKERRKKFEKQTQKFYQSQERYLNLSTKKDDQILQEADASLGMEQRHFVQASLEYVFLLQEVQERKNFEFVEIILSHTYSWLTFYHQGHDVHNDYKDYMTDLQERIQRTRQNFKATRHEASLLKNKMLEIQDPGSMNKMFTRQGYLFLMEKKAFGTTWNKYYCYYQKETKEFRMTSYNQIHQKMEMTLKSCVRRSSDSIDKRFCLDLSVQMHDKEKPPQVQVLTLQTLSEEDCKRWMDAMDGKEPLYSSLGCGSTVPRETTALDESGLTFITRAISILESKGLEDQGLYRLVGVSSKVSKLLALGLDPAKAEKLVLEDPAEWEVKTITSAIKQYFRNLPEPLMTYKLHCDFIAAAKNEKLVQRVNCTHHLVHKLPKTNFRVLKTLMHHLCNVAKKSDKNLMTVSNLGVCFGPTLLRPEEESVAAIMDIKFCNIVVEILIEHFDTVFGSLPTSPLDLMTQMEGGSTSKQSSSASLSSSSTPKSSPTPTSHSPSGGGANPQPPHLCQVAASKANQPVLQTVVTSFTTVEPQTVHFGNQGQGQGQGQGSNSSSSASQAQGMVRSEASSNLKNQSGGAGGGGSGVHHSNHHSHHSYQSSRAPGGGGGAPPPPSATHVWSHGGHSVSTSSLNSGLNSQPSLTSLTSGPGSLFDVGGSSSTSNTNHNSHNHNNNNNGTTHNNNHHLSSSSSSTRPSRPPGPSNGKVGAPLFLINPLSRTECVGSSSSSCESLSSRSSRDPPAPPAPLPPPPHSTSLSSSSSSPQQSSKRLHHHHPPPPPPPHLLHNHHHLHHYLSGGISSSSSSTTTSSSSSLLLHHLHHHHPPSLVHHNGDPTPPPPPPPPHHHHHHNRDRSSTIPPPPPHQHFSLNVSSSARLGTAYPPTYRQHMETKRVRTLYACVGENDSELSFEPNQILTNVRPSKEPGWLEGTLNGKNGLVPENYVEYIDDKGSLPTLISQRNTDV